MKKVLIALSVMFLWSTVAFADINLPAASKVIVKANAVFTSDLKFSSEVKGKLTLAVPLSTRQQDGTPKFFADKNELINGGWTRVVGDGQYEVKTEKSSGSAMATLENLGENLIWLRGWGKVGDGSKDNWMDINLGSEYVRLDAKGNPAYELIYNPKTGELMKVPKDYPLWE